MLAQQATTGIDVWLFTLRELTSAAQAEAARVGVNLATSRLQRFQTLSRAGARDVERLRPDIVHFHSVYVPGHAQLSHLLRRLGIPYVISPHGGLHLWRSQRKKAMYAALVEKPHFRGAEVILVLTERERRLIGAWLGGHDGPRRSEIVPNSIRPLPTQAWQWRSPEQRRLVYLGRFDVWAKGLDRLVAIAGHLPDAEVIAYGTASGAEQQAFVRLCRSGLSPNMRFHDPVYNDQKFAALAEASIYVQLSRDEGFGMSIVEAMRQGVPTAVTEGCDIVDVIRDRDLGLVVPDDPARAAETVATSLRDPERLRHWSRAGQEWTRAELSPKNVADRVIAIYDSVIRAPGAAT
ncbi:MAG: hypothetical protein JWM19_4332 [Actinomycetia bacterium]|nr:hypothetical protein [Actinomycetes bacterium]